VTELRINERKALALWATTRQHAVTIARECGMSTSLLGRLVRKYGIGRPPNPKPTPRSRKSKPPRQSYYARSPTNERKRDETRK